MAKTRQIRIRDRATITSTVNQHVGDTISIVLNDNRVLVGRIKQVFESGLTLMNQRLKNQNVSLDQIAEIYFDHHQPKS